MVNISCYTFSHKTCVYTYYVYETVTILSKVNHLILGIEHGFLSESATKHGYTILNQSTFLCDAVVVSSFTILPAYKNVIGKHNMKEKWFKLNSKNYSIRTCVHEISWCFMRTSV